MLNTVFAMLALAAPPDQGATRRPMTVHPRPLASASQAKAIAARETGGHPVNARQIPLNGATGGWEVLVRMPEGSRGWRCIIDSDTRTLRRREAIPNPPIGRRR